LCPSDFDLLPQIPGLKHLKFLFAFLLSHERFHQPFASIFPVG
jgi:hypothetical protein